MEVGKTEYESGFEEVLTVKLILPYIVFTILSLAPEAGPNTVLVSLLEAQVKQWPTGMMWRYRNTKPYTVK